MLFSYAMLVLPSIEIYSIGKKKRLRLVDNKHLAGTKRSKGGANWKAVRNASLAVADSTCAFDFTDYIN
jgi:hypothetical protein